MTESLSVGFNQRFGASWRISMLSSSSSQIRVMLDSSPKVSSSCLRLRFWQ